MIPLLKALTRRLGPSRPRRAALPSDLSPTTAVLGDAPFTAAGWIFERQLDGERVLAVSDGREVRLRARNGADVSHSYPELSELLSRPWPIRGAQPAGAEATALPSFVLDGEVVAFSGPVTSFARLQARLRAQDAEEARRTGVPVRYHLFDILYLDGYDLRTVPLRNRKALLREVVPFGGPLRFTRHHDRQGEALFRQACGRGWAGIVGKRASSPYSGGSSRDWWKFRCVNRQPLVIGGFTDPGGRREGFGALLVGHFEKGALRYAGKVGTGFDDADLRRLGGLLRAREQRSPPFSRDDAGELPREGVHWVAPELVGHFGFSEWTHTGKLRHPRFFGLRRDRRPDRVTRERPLEAPPATR